MFVKKAHRIVSVLDDVSNILESKGHYKIAAEIDVLSNTIEKLGKAVILDDSLIKSFANNFKKAREEFLSENKEWLDRLPDGGGYGYMSGAVEVKESLQNIFEKYGIHIGSYLGETALGWYDQSKDTVHINIAAFEECGKYWWTFLRVLKDDSITKRILDKWLITVEHELIHREQ